METVALRIHVLEPGVTYCKVNLGVVSVVLADLELCTLLLVEKIAGRLIFFFKVFVSFFVRFVILMHVIFVFFLCVCVCVCWLVGCLVGWLIG